MLSLYPGLAWVVFIRNYFLMIENTGIELRLGKLF